MLTVKKSLTQRISLGQVVAEPKQIMNAISVFLDKL